MRRERKDGEEQPGLATSWAESLRQPSRPDPSLLSSADRCTSAWEHL